MVLFPFFSYSGKHQFHHLIGCHATGINSLRISFINTLSCLTLLCQAIKLKWIIVSKSSSSKLTLLIIYTHHFVEYHATGINFLLTFLKCFALFKSTTRSHNSDMKNCRLYFCYWSILLVPYIYPQSSSTKFSNNWIDLDF